MIWAEEHLMYLSCKYKMAYSKCYQPMAILFWVAMILTVGLMGLIQAVTICSGMMDHARRQTLATQILNQHIQKLRLLPWDAGLPPPNELCISGLPSSSTTITIDPQFDNAIYSSGATYSLSRTTIDVASGSLREATFTVVWTVTSSRKDDSGNPVTFTYTRVNSAYYSKYSLNLSYQRS